MTENPTLRPIERRILRLLDQGVSEEEVAQRFRRSPDMIRRMVALTSVPRSGDGTGGSRAPSGPLRPLERRVLRWRESGAGYPEIGERFHHSADFVQRVEGLARYKLGGA